MTALGFGEAETRRVHDVFNECFSVDFLAEAERMEEHIKEIERKYHSAGDRYKGMTRDAAPPRYLYFWAALDVFGGGWMVEFTFHHINRRHPFASDGWAMMRDCWVAAYRSVYDKVRIFREAYAVSAEQQETELVEAEPFRVKD